MTNVIKMIGSFIIAAIMTAIPILCGLSFALDWNRELQFLLIVGTALILSANWNNIIELSEQEEKNDKCKECKNFDDLTQQCLRSECNNILTKKGE